VPPNLSKNARSEGEESTLAVNSMFSFSVLTLFVGRQEGQPAKLTSSSVNIDTEGLLKVTGSHVNCKCVTISETVQHIESLL